MVKKTEDGIDLAETMVAIILIVSAILAVTTMLIRSQIMQADNETQARATLLVQDHLEKARQVPYKDLATGTASGTPGSSTCTTVAPVSNAAERKAFSEKLGCYSPNSSRNEKYILSEHSPTPYIQKQTVSGTEYTIGYHVTRMTYSRGTETGWTTFSANNGGSKCNAEPTDADRPNPNANPYDSDVSKDNDYMPPCTIKHVTVEASWKSVSGEIKTTSSSWVRTPQTHEEVPPNILVDK